MLRYEEGTLGPVVRQSSVGKGDRTGGGRLILRHIGLAAVILLSLMVGCRGCDNMTVS